MKVIQSISCYEERKNRKPTRHDYRELESLFFDFCIKTEIPKFDTLIELEIFRKKEIRKKLS